MEESPGPTASPLGLMAGTRLGVATRSEQKGSALGGHSLSALRLGWTPSTTYGFFLLFFPSQWLSGLQTGCPDATHHEDPGEARLGAAKAYGQALH